MKLYDKEGLGNSRDGGTLVETDNPVHHRDFILS